MAPIDILKQRLAEAEQAYHELSTGQSVRTFVDQNGERVEYNAANAYRLSTYIAELRRRINAASGLRATGRPMGVYL